MSEKPFILKVAEEFGNDPQIKDILREASLHQDFRPVLDAIEGKIITLRIAEEERGGLSKALNFLTRKTQHFVDDVSRLNALYKEGAKYQAQAELDIKVPVPMELGDPLLKQTYQVLAQNGKPEQTLSWVLKARKSGKYEDLALALDGERMCIEKNITSRSPDHLRQEFGLQAVFARSEKLRDLYDLSFELRELERRHKTEASGQEK